MDDDDAFLYGDSTDVKVEQPTEGKGQFSIPFNLTIASNGGVSSAMAA